VSGAMVLQLLVLPDKLRFAFFFFFAHDGVEMNVFFVSFDECSLCFVYDAL
jgi:hypothetical protein